MMTKLSEFYSQRKALSVDKEPSLMHELAWDATEDKLIRQEVLPELLHRIAPILNEVESPLSLHIDYEPGGKLSISFTRNTVAVSMPTKVSAGNAGLEQDTDIQQQEEDTISTENQQQDLNEPAPEPIPQEQVQSELQSSPRTKIRVTTPEGKVFFNNKVWFTLRDVILYAGIGRVQGLHQEVAHLSLLADEQNEKYAKAQKEIAPNVFLFTNTNTPQKLAQIQEISNRLNLNLKIETV